MKKFTKQFLGEVLQLKDDEVKLVMECQRKFPELLLNEGANIDSAKKLYSELGLNPTQWARWHKKNVIENEFFKENESWWVLDIKSTTEKGGKVGQDFTISLEFAKHLAMMGRSENSHKVRSYFILMEKAVKCMQDYLIIREPEKQGYNEMKQHIMNWCDLNNYDKTLDIFYTREANMLNECLTGKTALELKAHIGFRDRETREHLTVETNKALYELQLLNSSLLMANMSFDARKDIIKTTCKVKYSELYIK